MRNPLSILAQALDKRIADEIRAKSAIAAQAVLAEAPLLDDLLDGKEIEVTMKIQLKRVP